MSDDKSFSEKVKEAKEEVKQEVSKVQEGAQGYLDQLKGNF